MPRLSSFDSSNDLSEQFRRQIRISQTREYISNFRSAERAKDDLKILLEDIPERKQLKNLWIRKLNELLEQIDSPFEIEKFQLQGLIEIVLQDIHVDSLKLLSLLARTVQYRHIQVFFYNQTLPAIQNTMSRVIQDSDIKQNEQNDTNLQLAKRCLQTLGQLSKRCEMARDFILSIHRAHRTVFKIHRLFKQDIQNEYVLFLTGATANRFKKYGQGGDRIIKMTIELYKELIERLTHELYAGDCNKTFVSLIQLAISLNSILQLRQKWALQPIESYEEDIHITTQNIIEQICDVYLCKSLSEEGCYFVHRSITFLNVFYEVSTRSDLNTSRLNKLVLRVLCQSTYVWPYISAAQCRKTSLYVISNLFCDRFCDSHLNALLLRDQLSQISQIDSNLFTVLAQNIERDPINYCHFEYGHTLTYILDCQNIDIQLVNQLLMHTKAIHAMVNYIVSARNSFEHPEDTTATMAKKHYLTAIWLLMQKNQTANLDDQVAFYSRQILAGPLEAYSNSEGVQLSLTKILEAILFQCKQAINNSSQ